MYDANNHPNQDALNNRVAEVLADTVRGLSRISKEYNVEAKSLAEQFIGSYKFLMEKAI